MHRSSARGPALSRRFTISLTVAAIAALLSACMGQENTSPAAVVTTPDGLQTTKDGSIIVNAQNFAKTTMDQCPPVFIRPGTEAVVQRAGGKSASDPSGSQAPIQYQASILNTARECSPAASGVSVKLGVLGRVVAGPAGKAGTITLPMRVVVVEGTDKVLKSDLTRVTVNLTAPDFGADFTKIFDGIAVPMSPGNTDFRIYVGFDDGKKL